MTRRLAALLLIAVASPAVPAAAQDQGGDKVNMVMVYGDDPNPECSADEICVIAHLPESERYRIPPNLRTSSSAENMAWAQRVERFEMLGKFGGMSCSATGTGSELGCTQEMIRAAYEAKDESSAVRFGRLIEQARAERLSSIDVEAAAEQERVEQLERAYMEKLERERSAPLPGEAAAAAVPDEGAGASGDQ